MCNLHCNSREKNGATMQTRIFYFLVGGLVGEESSDFQNWDIIPISLVSQMNIFPWLYLTFLLKTISSHQFSDNKHATENIRRKGNMDHKTSLWLWNHLGTPPSQFTALTINQLPWRGHFLIACFLNSNIFTPLWIMANPPSIIVHSPKMPHKKNHGF